MKYFELQMILEGQGVDADTELQFIVRTQKVDADTELQFDVQYDANFIRVEGDYDQAENKVDVVLGSLPLFLAMKAMVKDAK